MNVAVVKHADWRTKKLENIKYRLKLLRVKVLWNKRKFNWRVIRHKYRRAKLHFRRPRGGILDRFGRYTNESVR